MSLQIKNIEINPAQLFNESAISPDYNWSAVIKQIVNALETPKTPQGNQLENLLSYQREINFYHLKVELLAKTADSLNSVFRRVGQ